MKLNRAVGAEAGETIRKEHDGDDDDAQTTNKLLHSRVCATLVLFVEARVYSTRTQLVHEKA